MKKLLAALLVFGVAVPTFAHFGGYFAGGAQVDMQSMHEQAEQALESGDYQAWLQIHEDFGMPAVTEEQFQLMAQMHEAVENGDYEEAARLRSELGFTGHGMMGLGRGMMGAGFGGGCPMMGGF